VPTTVLEARKERELVIIGGSLSAKTPRPVARKTRQPPHLKQ